MLGLIDFEIVSMSSLEESQNKQSQEQDIYQYSIDDSDPIYTFIKKEKNGQDSTDVFSVLHKSLTKNRFNSFRSTPGKPEKMYSSPECKVQQVNFLQQDLADQQNSRNEDCDLAGSEDRYKREFTAPIYF